MKNKINTYYVFILNRFFRFVNVFIELRKWENEHELYRFTGTCIYACKQHLYEFFEIESNVIFETHL